MPYKVSLRKGGQTQKHPTLKEEKENKRQENYASIRRITKKTLGKVCVKKALR